MKKSDVILTSQTQYETAGGGWGRGRRHGCHVPEKCPNKQCGVQRISAAKYCSGIRFGDQKEE